MYFPYTDLLALPNVKTGPAIKSSMAHPFEEEEENRTTAALLFNLLDLSKVAIPLLTLAMFLTLSQRGRSWLLLCKVLWRRQTNCLWPEMERFQQQFGNWVKYVSRTVKQVGQSLTQNYWSHCPCSSWCWSSCCWSSWRASLGRRKTVSGRSPWELFREGKGRENNYFPFAAIHYP